MARRKALHIPDAILDQLLAGADPKTAFDANCLLDGLKKALAERVLNAEMDHHLAAEEAGNSRNGYGRKTVTTESGCRGRCKSRPLNRPQRTGLRRGHSAAASA